MNKRNILQNKIEKRLYNANVRPTLGQKVVVTRADGSQYIAEVIQIHGSIKNWILKVKKVNEDATKYIESDPPKTVRQLVLASKQRNLDIIFTFHTYRSIPPKLLSWADALEVFKTGENIQQFKKKIPLFEQVQKVFNEVANHPSRFHHQSIRLR